MNIYNKYQSRNNPIKLLWPEELLAMSDIVIGEIQWL